MSIQKVVLLTQFSNEYLQDMCSALARGFLQEGIDARLINAEEKPDAVRKQIDELHPDMIFEINRTRNQNKQLIPDEIIHIAWIQDAWFNNGSGKPKQLHAYDPNFGGSDITYTLLSPSYFGLEHKQNEGIWGCLHTGIEPYHFYPTDEPVIENSAAICGYIPDPPQYMKVRGYPLAWNQAGRQYMSDRMVNYLLNDAKVSTSKHSYTDIHNLMAAEMSRDLGCEIHGDQIARSLDQCWLMLYMDTELPRLNDRINLARAAHKSGLDLQIYGYEGWLLWAEFALDYRGNLRWKSDLAQVYRHTQFNLHNGAFGMHSRVLDCMASGGSIFVSTGRYADNDIQHHFVDGEHYIATEIETWADTLASWRGRSKELRAIGHNAAEEVLKHHTWRHRAREIIADLESLAAMAAST